MTSTPSAPELPAPALRLVYRLEAELAAPLDLGQSLPLHPWMEISVRAPAEHPNDPALAHE